MFRKLLLALLVACLAAPAVAGPVQCASQQAAAEAHHADHHSSGHEAPAPQVTVKSHDCIGCIAPFAAFPVMPAAEQHGLPPLALAQVRYAVNPAAAPEPPPSPSLS